jgi:hypothetical protein
MKLASSAIALAALFGAVKLWTNIKLSDWASPDFMVGAGLGLIVLVLIAVVWLRNRQRRRLTDMRDSALW